MGSWTHAISTSTIKLTWPTLIIYTTIGLFSVVCVCVCVFNGGPLMTFLHSRHFATNCVGLEFGGKPMGELGRVNPNSQHKSRRCFCIK